MLTINSKDNQYLRLARSLQQKKGRIASGCFLIEGIRLAEEALSCLLPICFAIVAEDADSRILALARELDGSNIAVYQVSPALLAGITATEHSQGIAMVASLPKNNPLPEGGHCYALCDGIADPGNLGTIIRSAYAAGLAGLMLTDGCADLYNPKTVRAAMGALFRLPVYAAVSGEEAYALARSRGLMVYITDADGRDIRSCDAELKKPHLWVLGSEAEGVSPYLRETADLSVSLPMREGAESLNVASAAAVLFYQSFFGK
jgi:RNA methyltransferase, TrmH family